MRGEESWPWIALEEERNERGGAVLEKQVPVWPPQFHDDIVCANGASSVLTVSLGPVCFPLPCRSRRDRRTSGMFKAGVSCHLEGRPLCWPDLE